MKNSYIQKSFPRLAEISDAQVIIVDSYSTDGTKELAQQYQFTYIPEDSNCRASRLKTGIKAAKGDYIVLHHPRSLLEKDFTKQLHGEWGAFTHKFDHPHWLLRFTSFWSNYVRGRRGIFYLDHCLFFKSKYKNLVLTTPDVAIFEDTEICLRLRSEALPTLVPAVSTTSAVRFTKKGIFKQALINQWMKWMYYIGINHQKMNQSYEKDLNLNG